VLTRDRLAGNNFAAIDNIIAAPGDPIVAFPV
jgi:hypothetical protein